MNTKIFALGSADAEMFAIESLLKRLGVPYVYGAALNRAGVMARVAPGMHATGVIDPVTGAVLVLDLDDDIVGVEVTFNGVKPLIDHHEPGDARTNAPPSQAFEASSLGQTFAMLTSMGFDATPTAEDIMAGESDHCLVAFAQGRCSTPKDEAREYILRTRHAMFGRHLTFEAFCTAVQTAVETVSLAPCLNGYANAADLRDLVPDAPPAAGTGEVYPTAAQFLPVAAALANRGYAVNIKRGDGKRALRIGGFEENHPILIAFDQNPEAWGVLGKNATPPNNAYAFPARGMGGGTYAD
jgi:hypothetical protein